MTDLISRQAALNIRFNDAINEDGVLYVPLRDFTNGLKALPSAQPEYYDYSDIDDVWEFYAEEQDINFTDNAKQLKDAMWVGYQKGKQDAQPKETARSEEGHAFKEKEDVLNFIEEILNSPWCGGGNHLSDWEIGYKAGLMDIKERLEKENFSVG